MEYIVLAMDIYICLCVCKRRRKEANKMKKDVKRGAGKRDGLL